MSKQSTCPWWMGYLLLIPIRKLTHNPTKILKPYVKEGMTVVDFGSAMGYFSLPMAKMVGDSGKVYCFDIQQKMLDSLMVRAQKAHVAKRIHPVLIEPQVNTSAVVGEADFALLFAVAHEVENQEELFTQLYAMLKPGGKLYFAEPKGHVTIHAFKHSIATAVKARFTQAETLEVGGGYAVMLEKK